MYGLTLITAPTAEPLTPGELKDWCRISGTASDDLVAALGKAARVLIERRIGRQLVTATWRLTLPGFPWPNGWQLLDAPPIFPDPHTIRIPKAPLQSVSSVGYYDLSNTLQTLASTVYDVDAAQDPGTLSLAMNQVWPVTRLRPDAVRITFVAGYGAASAVPEELKLALKMLVAYWIENRGEAEAGAEPPAVKALLDNNWNGALEYAL